MPLNKTFLILGVSGAGKTTLAINLCRLCDRKTFLINNNYFEHKPEGVEISNLQNFYKFNNCSVIIDDLINVRHEDKKIIKYLINFASHHKALGPVCLISQAITGNNIFDFCNGVTGIIFLSYGGGTVGSLKQTLRFFSIDKSKVEKYVKEFQKRSNERKIFLFDLSTLTFKMTNLKQLTENWEFETVQVDKKEEILTQGRRLLKYVRGRNTEAAKELLNLIISTFDFNQFDNDEFSITLQKKKSGKQLKINLIQFIQTCCTTKQPTQKEIEFFKVILSRRKIPSFLIVNSIFQSMLS